VKLVHLLSFDILDSQAIQRRTAKYCSYLNWFTTYTEENICRIDLLLAKPQATKLVGLYNKSVKILKLAEVKKLIIQLEEHDEYTYKVAQSLLSF
jgi:hypothetical protein